MQKLSKEQYKEWIDSLKVGDEVVLKRQHLANSPELNLTRIETITPKRQMRVALSKKLLFKDGIYYEPRGCWSSTDYSLLPVTEEILTEIKKKKQLMDIQTMERSAWEKLSPDKIDAIHKIMFASG